MIRDRSCHHKKRTFVTPFFQVTRRLPKKWSVFFIILTSINHIIVPIVKPETLVIPDRVRPRKEHTFVSGLPQKLSYEDGSDLIRKLRPNIDGVIVQDGKRQATFLPQVWRQLPDPKRFLSRLCQKSGLPEDTWSMKKPAVYTYQVQSFHEEQ